MKIACAVAVAVVLAIAATAHARSVRTIDVTIHHSHFTPEHIDVRRGERVRFVVRNEDPIDHEFIVGPAPIQLMHELGTDALHNGPGAVSVPLFTTRSTTYTFRDEPASLFGCHLPGHWAYGMQGSITLLPSHGYQF